MNNIRNVISQLAKSGGDTVAMVCTVDAVDKKARTIDCTPIDEGAPLLGVNIQANQGSDIGMCVFPEIGSYVVVGFMSDGAAAMVMLTDRIESAEIVIGTVSAVMNADGVTVSSGESTIKVTAGDIIFNGGELGGLVNIAELTGRFNAIERDINALKTAIKGWTPVSQDGGGALKSATADWSANMLAETSREDYEDTSITH